MPDWPIARLEEAASRIGMGPFGSSIKVETFVPTGLPVISGQHLWNPRLRDLDFNFVTEQHADRLKSANVFRGDVIFTHAGSIGQVSYIPQDSRFERYVLSQRQFYLRPDTRYLIPAFLVYYFRGPLGRAHLLANASSTGVPSIAQPVSYLRSLHIRLPPLSEQRAIAEVLGALDDKIEANRRIAERVERLAIDVSVSTMATTTVGDVAEVHRDLVSTAAFASQEVEHFSLPAFDSSRLPCVENGDGIKSGKFLLNGPTVLVSKLNPHISRVWMAVPTGACSAVTSTEFVGLVPSGDYPVEVLWALCASAEFSSQLAEMVKGTTGSHQRVSVDDVLSLKVPDPEVLGKEVMEIITAAVGLAGTLRKESLRLATLRDALLPKLLSGDLQVRDPESLEAQAV